MRDANWFNREPDCRQKIISEDIFHISLSNQISSVKADNSYTIIDLKPIHDLYMIRMSDTVFSKNSLELVFKLIVEWHYMNLADSENINYDPDIVLFQLGNEVDHLSYELPETSDLIDYYRFIEMDHDLIISEVCEQIYKLTMSYINTDWIVNIHIPYTWDTDNNKCNMVLFSNKNITLDIIY